MAAEPKILFGSLKKFPQLDKDDKIQTNCFLDSAAGIAGMIESFGKLFTPIVNDMKGNIEKINRQYLKDIEKYHYLEDMLLDEEGNATFNLVALSLLWLKRGLELLEKFLTCILEDKACNDNLKPHLMEAYKLTLQPYHGFLLQKGCAIIYNFVPTRTTLIGPQESSQENLKALESFLFTFRKHLNHLNNFYTVHKLNKTNKV